MNIVIVLVAIKIRL